MDPLFEDTRPSIRSLIEVGDNVYDLAGMKVGTVSYIQFPTYKAEIDLNIFPYDRTTKDMPDDLAYHLLRAGFICINPGVLSKERFALLEQVAGSAGNEIYLNIPSEDLFTL